MSDVLLEVDCERRLQDMKWGEQNHPQPCWVTILAEELGEWSHEVLIGNYSAAREELIQIAAVAVAAIESLDRNELKAVKIGRDDETTRA